MSVLGHSLFGIKTMSPLILQFNKRIKWRDIYFSSIDCYISAKPFTTSVPNSIKYHSNNEWTDKTFSNRLIKSLKQPRVILGGLYNFIGEFGKLYEEKKQDFFLNSRQFQCQDSDNNVEMLFTFDSQNDLNKFMVTTDSAHYGGYSSASLKITPTKTALFTGNVCSELLKDGEAKFAGYATMITQKSLRSFKRIKCFDWSYYTHLVFKVKGDGRTYYVHFTVKVDYEDEQSWVYSYPLFTRGGPHWQVSKIPLSNFFFITKGKMGIIQPNKVPLKKITTLGLTTRQIDGPFKLEIEYIGLELDKYHRAVSPYEHYA